mmetsp:Transcript_5436/g.8091  ORF Transcript_5436/g.8091 Transcript_5436/m.8091 type:complete len:202 (-) Transcript_5436:157-762(-)|eukprot:CAMPEP_0194088440 /NCGR_PEP_ID=MMETSP0149-20130528/29122_1 /TAXON_ID=122233 /ORGANISM="Chaetoceros debilis, Strain MM31A-1" /LENGTH=201 /DNA_ID=CAMNT_0038772087 /DNA_START=268 /DNA_END=873 /DNA_ORIENTATION=+
MYQEANGGYGSGLVPMLEHGDKLVIESDVVAKYVAQNINGADGMGDGMYPDPVEDVEFYQHLEEFLHVWQRATDTYYDVLRASSQEEAKNCEKQFTTSLMNVDALLQKYDGDFILGEIFSTAECISAPWIQRAFITLPYFRGIDLEDDIISKNSMEHVSAWMKAVRDRPSCVESCCPEDEMIAACKRYYVSFLSPGAKGSL